MSVSEIKLSRTPSGVVKVSWGLGVRSSGIPLVNRSKLQDSPPEDLLESPRIWNGDEYCPPVEPLKPGWGGLGKKAYLSYKSASNGRERMAAMERVLGRENCFFITLTIPSSSPRAWEGLARFSSYAVNRLSVWLRDSYDVSKMARVGVWEYQGRGALHYHLALGAPWVSGEPIEEFRLSIAKVWMSVLESIDEMFDCNSFMGRGFKTRNKDRLLDYQDLGERFANVQRVEKSISAYLSKYLCESNHDSNKGNKKTKNELRSSLYSVATWMQWNRNATEYLKDASYSGRFLIAKGACQDFFAIRDCVVETTAKAEGTQLLSRKNYWWDSRVFILPADWEAEGCPCKAIVAMLKEACIIELSMGLVKAIPRLPSGKKTELELLLHDEKIATYKEDLSTGRELGTRLAETLTGMLLLAMSSELRLEKHKEFSPCLKNSKQLPLLDSPSTSS